MLKQRVITAIILLALFLSALFALPATGWALLVIILIGLGAKEWAGLSKLSGSASWLYLALSLALMAGLTLPAAAAFALPVYLVAALLWLVVVPLWLTRGWRLHSPALMALLGWAVLLPTGLAMLELRSISPWLLLGVMALVWIADSAAYFAGRRFGKHKLAPSISPGKTWEGAAGAVAGVCLYVLAVALSQDAPLFGLPLPALLLVALCWVVFSIYGDLFESALKRQAGIKDSGTLLPGHGGLLDRIDALTSTLPLAALALILQRLA